MVHTYRRARGSSWPENRLLSAVARIAYHAFQALFFGIIALVLIGIGWARWSDPGDRVSLTLFLGVAILIGLPLSAYWLSTYCREIRLGEDGFCEFETRRRVVRTQVAEIASVKEEVDEDGDRNYYLRFRDRSRLWTCGLADFDDFLTRIEAFGVAILIGLPLSAYWLSNEPEHRDQATQVMASASALRLTPCLRRTPAGDPFRRGR